MGAASCVSGIRRFVGSFRYRNLGGRFLGCVGRLRRHARGKVLNCRPDARHRFLPISELLDPGYARQAVPDFNQAGTRPLSGQLRQPGLVAEALRVRYGFGILRRRVNCDVLPVRYGGDSSV